MPFTLLTFKFPKATVPAILCIKAIRGQTLTTSDQNHSAHLGKQKQGRPASVMSRDVHLIFEPNLVSLRSQIFPSSHPPIVIYTANGIFLSQDIENLKVMIRRSFKDDDIGSQEVVVWNRPACPRVNEWTQDMNQRVFFFLFASSYLTSVFIDSFSILPRTNESTAFLRHSPFLFFFFFCLVLTTKHHYKYFWCR